MLLCGIYLLGLNWGARGNSLAMVELYGGARESIKLIFKTNRSLNVRTEGKELFSVLGRVAR